MFLETKLRETSGVSGNQNQLFPSGPYIKCIMIVPTNRSINVFKDFTLNLK